MGIKNHYHTSAPPSYIKYEKGEDIVYAVSNNRKHMRETVENLTNKSQNRAVYKFGYLLEYLFDFVETRSKNLALLARVTM